MNDLMLFDYNGSQIRTVDNDGQIWWVLKDICNILSISHIKDTVKRLDEDEVGQTEVLDRMGRMQSAYIINESGLYSVILRSDKPEAKPFRRWVTHEVLPTIRKTGSYSASSKSRHFTWYGVEVMTVNDIADYYGISCRNALAKLRTHYRDGLDYFILKGDSLKLFKFENKITSAFSSITLLRVDVFKQPPAL